MSPATTTSDSEDDFDYVPPADGRDSDSSDELAHAVDGSAKPAPPEANPTEKKRRRDALWATFQASVSTPPLEAERTGGSGKRPETRRVKIAKTHLFAGKHVTEVLEVSGDSEEARKWPRWSPTPCASESAPAACFNEAQHKGETRQEEDRAESAGQSPAPPTVDPSPTPPASTPTSSTSTPAAKPPGPRKARTALPSIPKGSQAKKITTLDKSAMDWRAHVATQSSDVKDELNTNRRGGGYLEKVDFLQRVQDRREGVFEASKASKRRKT